MKIPALCTKNIHIPKENGANFVEVIFCPAFLTTFDITTRMRNSFAVTSYRYPNI